MGLFFLLLIPVLIGVAGLVFSKGRVDIREFGVHVAVILVIVCVPYAIALHGRTADVETWNGVVASKTKSDVSCCHPYCCATCTSCSTDSNGNTSCHDYCCATCYEHSHDVSWDAMSSNGEDVFHDGCNAPYSSEPRRWTQIVVGEPTAVEHSYHNYIKGNPDSILRRSGASEKFGKLVPKYPEVYDYYRSNRFLTVNVILHNMVALNKQLSEANARLGARKKVNIIILVVSEPDQAYLEAVREKWIGSKINDIVVVVGVDKWSLAIDWVGVISWSKSEQVKIDLRNAILDQKVLNPPELLGVVEREVSSKYEHRRISDFEYLQASITPTSGTKWAIFIIAVIISIFLQIYFWTNDPFGGHIGRYDPFNRNRF